jgi:heterodisulfide reductase subunit B
MTDTGPLAVTYYPGCSLESTGREYAESIEAMCHGLGVELVELEGWTCCGATSAGVLLGHDAATALPALTLKQAAEFDRPIFAPCAACYNRLMVAQRDLRDEPELLKRLGLDPGALRIKVLNIVDLLRDFVGLERLREQVTKPLTGLKVAAYYGCLLLRPRDMELYDDGEQPTSMEGVIAAVGAEPVEWALKMECCGAGLAGTMQDTCERLVGRLVRNARAAGADCAAAACQLCSMNLETRQGSTSPSARPLPVLYLSDLVGLALGCTISEMGLQRHLVDVRPLLEAQEKTATAAH